MKKQIHENNRAPIIISVVGVLLFLMLALASVEVAKTEYLGDGMYKQTFTGISKNVS